MPDRVSDKSEISSELSCQYRSAPDKMNYLEYFSMNFFNRSLDRFLSFLSSSIASDRFPFDMLSASIHGWKS